MTWNASGDDRAKGFKVYKDLQAKYDHLMQEYSALRDTVTDKNRTIARLARELSQALGSVTEEPESGFPMPSSESPSKLIPETPPTDPTGLEPTEPNSPAIRPLPGLRKTHMRTGQSLRDVLGGRKSGT